MTARSTESLGTAVRTVDLTLMQPRFAPDSDGEMYLSTSAQVPRVGSSRGGYEGLVGFGPYLVIGLAALFSMIWIIALMTFIVRLVERLIS